MSALVVQLKPVDNGIRTSIEPDVFPCIDRCCIIGNVCESQIERESRRCSIQIIPSTHSRNVKNDGGNPITRLSITVRCFYTRDQVF